MAKKGVLLINVGTPNQPTVKSVKEYLKEFLLDPDVIDIPAPLRHLLVRGIILRVRPKKIAPLYKKIWMEEGSPLRVYSDRVTKSLNQLIGDTKVEFAMRYQSPSIEEKLAHLDKEQLIKHFLSTEFISVCNFFTSTLYFSFIFCVLMRFVMIILGSFTASIFI